MKKIEIKTTVKKILADVYTPVGIYLRLRDRFRDTILLESADSHAVENSWSFIAVNAIGGIEILNEKFIEFKLPGFAVEKISLNKKLQVTDVLNDFMNTFSIVENIEPASKFAQGIYGYTTYDAVRFFDTIKFTKNLENDIGLLRYRLYQYVIAINHFNDELFICENHINGVESELPLLESLLKSKDIPQYPFQINGDESTNLTDEEFMNNVKKGIASCLKGDVFQIVISKKFEVPFIGDEFNVYRALRSINPSPYLFYFDYSDYKLMGSSPEAQIIIQNNVAVIHPIAGTYKRSGNEDEDKEASEKLLLDEKENAEHVMLVDLARNDLSRIGNNVTVSQFKKVQYYSHVIHLASEVKAIIYKGMNPFKIISKTFPAGTLSGAPKIKAMELIDEYEPTNRSFYGGAIGFIGFNGSCNHAIMIRTFKSQNNTLAYQVGAGVVVSSIPKNELLEVNNKLTALKKAIVLAEKI